MMTIRQAVSWGSDKLKSHGVENAEHDSFELLSAINGMTRTFYLVNGDSFLSEEDFLLFEEYIDKRAAHIPLQHIIGKAYFYGYEFEVNGDVLVPRQDTEILVGEVMKVARSGDYILDMCTGSGCIIITMALERKLSFACGCDLSDKALLVAESNRERLIPKDRYCFVNADGDNKGIFRFCQGDLFDSLDKNYGLNLKPVKFDVIVSNPPYIETEVINTLSDEVRLHEPVMALDGSADGLEFYRRISAKAPEYLKLGGYLLYEIGYNQGQQVSTIMEEAGFKDVEIIKDLAGLDRVVKARL